MWFNFKLWKVSLQADSLGLICPVVWGVHYIIHLWDVGLIHLCIYTHRKVHPRKTFVRNCDNFPWGRHFEEMPYSLYLKIAESISILWSPEVSVSDWSIEWAVVRWECSPGISFKCWWISSLSIQRGRQFITHEPGMNIKFHKYGLWSVAACRLEAEIDVSQGVSYIFWTSIYSTSYL